jgi:hypothetical protein
MSEAATQTRIAVVVRDDLETWQKLNVASFLVSGMGSRWPDLVGEPYEDADGVEYLSMFVTPVVVFAGDDAAVRRAFDRARDRGLKPAVYPDALWDTFDDEDNRAAVRGLPTEKLSLAGFAVAGERRTVDKAFDKLKLHR